MNLMPHLPLLSSHTLTGRSHTSLASLTSRRSNPAGPDSLCASRPPADWLQRAAETLLAQGGSAAVDPAWGLSHPAGLRPFSRRGPRGGRTPAAGRLAQETQPRGSHSQ